MTWRDSITEAVFASLLALTVTVRILARKIRPEAKTHAEI